MKIRIGSRGSALASWQAEHVRARLERLGHQVAIHTITTTGDRILDRRLESVGGKGAFLKEIEDAMLAEEIDLAVHSLKDVPTALPAGLVLCAVLERADARDALLSRGGEGLRELPRGARIGTTSLRRRSQLLALRPDFELQDLRGNVDTRLRRLGEGRFDAIVLAMAGLLRLGRVDAVSEPLEADVLVPAPGQGAIALECRAAHADVLRAAAPLHHEPTARAITAERTLLAALQGGCNVPLGAHATLQGDDLHLRAFVARPDGAELVRAEGRGADPESVGRQVAAELLARGARALMSA